MGVADNRRLRDFGMCHKRAFDLGGAHAVARDVEHIIDPAGDPVIAIRITSAAITGEVIAFEIREIGFHKPVVIAVNGAHLTGPAVFDTQHTFGFGAGQLCPVVGSRITGCTPKNGFVAEPGLVVVAPGKRGQKVTAGFGLPPGVDDRAITFSNHVMIPVPSLWIDRLPDGPKSFRLLKSHFSTNAFPCPISARMAVGQYRID